MNQNPIITANTAFGARLLGQLAARPEQNLVFSPLSITLALLLAHAGAAGATEQAIENTLGLGQLGREQAAKQAHELLDKLIELDDQAGRGNGPTGPVEAMWLRIANAIFVNQEISLRPNYIQGVREQFGAQVESLDFGAPSAAPMIDAWVRAQTRDKIREIAGEISRDTAAVLLNAVYFKAAWQNPFTEYNTRMGDFHPEGTQPVRVPMMETTDSYGYQRADGFELIALPLRGRGQVELLIMLPARGTAFAAALQRFAEPAAWAALDTRPTQIQLRLPRFRVECDINLNMPLQALGMGLAFTRGQADFSAMATQHERLFISDVRHKTFLDVNEKGVEAAAATAIKMMRTSVMPQRPITVTVDRPFLCALRERQSGTLLFVGAIRQP